MLNRYVKTRLIQVVPTVFGILVLTWVLIHLAPGDPILALAGEYGDEAYYARMRERYGLDRLLIVKLGVYIGHVLTGDLGVSFVQGRPALDIIMERLPATLLLSATALVLPSLLGIVLGTYAAARAHGLRDIAVTTGALGIYAAPCSGLAARAALHRAALRGDPDRGDAQPRLAGDRSAYTPASSAATVVLPTPPLPTTPILTRHPCRHPCCPRTHHPVSWSRWQGSWSWSR